MTVKERFKAADGNDVPLDYFLFSCHEAERMHRFTRKENPLTWPQLADLDVSAPSREMAQDTIQDLLSWYAAQFPQLKVQGVINYSRLGEVTEAVAKLCIDIKHVAEKLTGSEFHIGTGDQIDQRHQDIWNSLQEFVTSIFRNHCDLYLKYLQWSYEAPKEETFEPGSRPPVGKYAPPMRSRFGGDRDRGGGGDRGPRGGGDRGPRGGGGGQNRGPRGGGDRDRGPRGNDRGNNDRGGPRGGGDRGGQHRGGGDRDRGPRRGPPRDNSQGTEVAIAEVMDAVQRMKDDASVSKIPMKPANSFNRRLQHEQIKQSGFFSFSTGEGPSRAVVMSRDGNDSSDE